MGSGIFHFSKRMLSTAAVFLFLFLFLLGGAAYGQAEEKAAGGSGGSPVTIKVEGSDGKDVDFSTPVKIVLVLTLLTMIPAIVMTMTSFTRIVIVLSFVRRAMGTQEMPPNQVVIGLAIFMTLFVMFPVFSSIYSDAVAPYMDKKLSLDKAVNVAKVGISEFLLKQTREKDLALFVQMAKVERPDTPEDVPLYVLIPSFIISELRTAFQMGFVLFLPFIIIDMVIASILLSMGMFMLPPIIISTPFKILLFIMVDGWHLIGRSLALSFQ